MSLFDKLKNTQFKSLKFGNDKPGGGIGLEPIIRKPILDGNTVGTIPTFRDRAIENQSRIAVLLKSTPRGLNFISSQTGLQLSNTRLELTTGPTLNRFSETGGLGSSIANITNRIIDASNSAIGIYNRTTNQRFRTTALLPYNPDNTIAQVGALQGEHLDRFGLTPYIDDNLKYINIAKANNSGVESSNNRLARLRTKFSLGYDSKGSNTVGGIKAKLKTLLLGASSVSNSITSVSNLLNDNKLVNITFNPLLNQINNKINQISRIALPYLDPIIDQYIGGPGSTNGTGVTNIRRFDTTNTDAIINGKSAASAKFRKIVGRSGGGLLNQPKEKYIGSTAIYKNISNEPLSVELPQSLVGNTFDKLQAQKKKKSRVYGGAEVRINGTQTEYLYKLASVNSKDIERFGFSRKPTTPYKYFQKHGQFNENPYFDRDDSRNMSILFQLVDPFSGENLQRILFPAFINNFKVNTDATWNDISYIGRSENFYVYNKFKRQVSFGFQIPISNPVELRERHRALGALESSLAGAYGPTTYLKDGGTVRGNKLGGILTRLYFGSYFKGETGIINNISYEIPNESSWEIDDVKLAHNINVSVNFTVIHNVLPTHRKAGGFFTSIPNGVNYFMADEETLIGTGAAGDEFNAKLKPKFTTVTRKDEGENDFTITDQGANIPDDAYDASSEISPETLEARLSGENARNELETRLAGENARKSLEVRLSGENARNDLEAQLEAKRAKVESLRVENDNMTDQYRQIIENASQYGITNNNI
jgi:hypothetical protein